MFLKVGVIKYRRLQSKMMPGSVRDLSTAPWPLLINTARTPTDRSGWGMISYPNECRATNQLKDTMTAPKLMDGAAAV